MNVLIIGSGGREHALAHKISESKNLSKLFIAPGNPGTAKHGENVNLDINDHLKVVEFCNLNHVKLVVVGPEQPLVDGIADVLRENHIYVFGPGKDGARLEGDKAYSKMIMEHAKIPTAASRCYSKEEYASALEYLAVIKYPLVIKASGLAAGKGVVICNSLTEAVAALEDCFHNRIFGDAGDLVVIEEFLQGEEASIFVITDGKEYIVLPSSQDHKRIGDNDEGKNTGGMGAYAPAPIVTKFTSKGIEIEIISRLIQSLKKDRIDYRGCIYVGIMITKHGPYVIEYNCRFGDPEAQAVLPLLKGDFLELLYSAARGELNKEAVKFDNGSAVCVVASSAGYPDRYKKGLEIKGLDQDFGENIFVYHSGTKADNGKILTNGGRVLSVTAYTPQMDIIECKKRAYEALSKIHFEGIYYRKDISDKAFRKNPFDVIGIF